MPKQTELLKGPKKIYADDLVFADIECITDSTKTFIPVLICYNVDIATPFIIIGVQTV